MANADDGRIWAADLVKRVGAAVKAARGGKSAAWLSDRTAELGYRISPTVIAKLDSGHRGDVLGVAELLILAAALDVPPLVLLYPDLPSGQVEIIPGRVATSFDAYLWTAGEAPSITTDSVVAPTKGYRLIQAVLERNQLSVELAHLLVELGPKAHLHEQTDLDSMQRRRSAIRTKVAQLNAEIHESSGVLNDA